MRASQIEGHSEPRRARPESLTELFLTFTFLALQGFGGAAPIAQFVLVERKRWMTQQEFVEDWAVAQIMPGPNVVNMALMMGDRYFGVRGALIALAGMSTVPLILVLSLAIIYTEYAHNPIVSGALRSMGAVAAGLIIGMGFKLLSALKKNPIGLPAAIILLIFTFTAIAFLRWPLLWVLLGTGTPACLWGWLRLTRQERRSRS